ncbi:MAG: site-specific DNA-methyltransferase [Methanoregula sp.]|jgi:site-specific DNA-methyltransferase (adenine-specific)|uniref:DNA-methyltransferase n=1 Tax=Methanoregula sp. TaxID=2052170 RepID=UPI003D0B51AD
MEIPESGEFVDSRKKNRKYTPGLAALKFRPAYWTPEEAKELYDDYSGCPEIPKDIILFQDCISGMDAMPPNCVDLIIADPPFGLDFSGKGAEYNRDKRLVVDSYQEIDADYSEFTKNWMKSIQKIMKPNATAYIFSGWNHLEDILREARLNGLHTINHLIWKYQFGVFTKKKYVTSHYHILLLAKDLDNYYFNKMENYPEDVWDIKRKYKRGEIKNATTLPIDVVKKCIEFGSRPGDLVFDPFMGMGTTAVAAKSIWRHYFGFEINEKTKPMIQNRINDMPTGYEYTPLDEKIKEIHDIIQKKYPSAYQLYIKEGEGQINVKSEARGRNISGSTI